MSVLEMKNLLLKAIANSDDESFLQVLLMVVQDQHQDLLDWDQLPQETQKAINKGIEELEQDKGKPHALLLDKYKGWLQV